jgi:hypothetical protein
VVHHKITHATVDRHKWEIRCTLLPSVCRRILQNRIHWQSTRRNRLG